VVTREFTDAQRAGPAHLRRPAEESRVSRLLASARAYRDVILVGVLALVLRWLYLVTVAADRPIRGDARWYHDAAHLLATGHGYVRPGAAFLTGHDVHTAEFPPLWPTMLAVADFLGFDGVSSQRFLGAVVGAGTAVVTMLLARRILEAIGAPESSRRPAIVVGLLVACSPVLIPFDLSLMAESLYALLVTAFLLAVLNAYFDPSARRWIVAGTLLGLATLTQVEAIVFVVLLLVPFTRVAETRAWMRQLGFAVLPVVVLLGGWTVRNQIQLEAPQLIPGHNASILAGANCRQAYHGRGTGLWNLDCVLDVSAGADEVDASKAYRSAGLKYMRQHPADVPKVAATRALRTFGLYSPTAQQRFESGDGRPESWLRWGRSFSLFLFPFAVAGAVWLWRRTRPIALLLLAPMALVLGSALWAYGNSRYRMAFEPTYHLLAGFGLVLFGVWARQELQTRLEARRAAAVEASAPTYGANLWHANRGPRADERM
jgi:hypothetical protein